MDKKFMLLAIKEAKKGLETVGEGPFGACIVKNNEVIAVGNNRVVTDKDPTAHAEIVAIRRACQKLGSFELKGCEIYITCEPCPMCFGAIYWCRLEKMYYGCTRQEAAEIGFADQFIYDELAKDEKDRSLETFPKIWHEECKELFETWQNKENKIMY